MNQKGNIFPNRSGSSSKPPLLAIDGMFTMCSNVVTYIEKMHLEQEYLVLQVPQCTEMA